MPEDLVSLRVGGRELSGWQEVTVRRSIQQAAGTFVLETSERDPAQPSARSVRPGQTAQVDLGGDTVITGYVDSVSPRYDPERHVVQIQGRDAAGDLVDSSPNLETSVWENITLDRLVRQLAEPFGIEVRIDGEVGEAFEKVALTPGQTAWSLIEERARYRSLLPMSDGQGGLVLARAGAERVTTALVLGENLLSGRATFSHAQRFSEYTVKGQRQGTENHNGEAAAGSVGSASDAEIERHRPKLIVAGSGVDQAQCEEHARWQATVRAGRGAAASLVVAGWRSGGGALWPLNALVPVSDPFLGINQDMLIADVTYRKGEQGSTTELRVVRPEAFAPLSGGALVAGALGFAT